MANIEPEIDDFQSAIYGEEVRGSMISLARKLNTEVEAGSATINQYTVAITQAIGDANNAAGAANSAASSATTAAGAANNAANAANSSRASIESNESARQSAETARQSAEQGRAAAEAARVTAEQGRAAAETSRAAAENDRGNAEAARAAAEQDRAAAEAQRMSGEAERVGNESARVANENLRVAQERDRVNAETERQRAFNNMSQQVLPPATGTTIGGIIVGDGLSVEASGRVSVIGGGDIETRTHAEATYAKITDLATKANATHTHAASDITSGTLPVARGGTGLDASPSMLTNLGSTTADTVLKASPRPGVTGTLPIANGGTGATTAAGAAANIVDDQDIKPASVSATGEVSAKSGSVTHKLTDKAESSAIAYVESTTATSNHAVGDYFMLGGTLMVATSAIAAGETIGAGNATPATLFDYAFENRRKMESISISNATYKTVNSSGTAVSTTVTLNANQTKDITIILTEDKDGHVYKVMGITGVRPYEPNSSPGSIVVASYYLFNSTTDYAGNNDGITRIKASVRLKNTTSSSVTTSQAPLVTFARMTYK